MNLSGVEQCGAIVAFFTQDQRQLGAGKEDAFDLALGFHSIDDRKQLGAGLGQKNSRDELGEVLFVNVILVGRLRRDQLDSFPAKNLLIEIPLHGVSRSKKGETV